MLHSTQALKRWTWIHKWSSLVCTLFLLLLCITGLPLIFHHEIEDATRDYVVPIMPTGTPKASLDRVVEAARARHPEMVVQFAFVDADEPDLVTVGFGTTPLAQEGNKFVIVDARTAVVLDEPDPQSGVMYVLLKLHTDMFAGLPGKLFLGVMGMLFIVAVVSGIVVYGPYMGKQKFATVRTRSTRIRWLDLHNVIGIVTIGWVVVVGLTGVINTWADLAIKLWQYDQLSEMTAPYRDKPPLETAELGSVERAMHTAGAAMPDLKFAFVAYPGTLFSSPHHYAVFMRGTSPLEARLLKPALIDAKTGNLTDSRDLPWYITGRADLAALAFRRLRRSAAEDRVGAARPRHDHRAGQRRLPVARQEIAGPCRAAVGSRGPADRRRTARRPGRPAMSRTREQRRFRRIWLWPLVLTIASLIGLVSALVGDGVWDVLSWLTLAAPIAVIGGCNARQPLADLIVRSPQPGKRRRSVPAGLRTAAAAARWPAAPAACCRSCGRPA